MMGKPHFSVIETNTNYVSVIVGEKAYNISEEKDKELIDKATTYKKSLDRKNPIPRNYLYCLWISLYQESSYNYYLDPIYMKLLSLNGKDLLTVLFPRGEELRRKEKNVNT